MTRWFRNIVILAGLLLLVSPTATASPLAMTAVLFIAHTVTHEDASVTPIRAVGGQPVTFEVRVREAGTTEKAGWQAQIVLDACKFDTPAASAVRFGDFMQPGTPIAIGPQVALDGNRLLISQGQFFVSGATTAAEGLLATITVTPKRSPQCPDPSGTPGPEASVELDLTSLAAPGGLPYSITTLAGKLTYVPVKVLFLPLVARP